MKAKKQITQIDLAQILGLDRSSVSLALRNSDKISEATRKLVLETARKHHYRPNIAAQQLRSSKTNSLGLVIPDTFQTLSEPVVVRTIQALAGQVANHGMALTIFSTAVFFAREPLQARIQLPDGLFVWGNVAADTLHGRIPDGHPVLVLDPTHPSYATDQALCVRPDNADGAAAMVRHLLARGSKRLLFVIDSEEHLGLLERWKGAKSEWLRQMPQSSISYARHQQLTDLTLRKFASVPDGAIFCSSDGGAIDVWRRLKDLGIAMPDDVKLAGFDNTPTAQLIGLTSAVFECEHLAESALSIMLQLVAGHAVAGDIPRSPITVHIGTTT